VGEDGKASLFELAGAPQLPRRLTDKNVVVREVGCKSLLNRCSIDDYSFNCYVGCAHGCRYCYARFMQRFHPHAEEWGHFVDVKVNAAEVLAPDILTCSIVSLHL